MQIDNSRFARLTTKIRTKTRPHQFRLFPFLRYNSKYLYLFERISIDLKFFLRTLFSVYKNEEEAVNQDSENVVLRAFEVLRSWKVATIQLKEKTDETQYSLWISETLKLPAEVKLKDEAEINIGGMIILCTRGFRQFIY